MGQKVHPVGFRLGYIADWQSRWYSSRHYAALLREDLDIRGTINKILPEAGIARVEIERNANHVTVTIHTARPGIVIGRGGSRVDEVRNQLEKLTAKRVRVNINEIRVPEMDAALVARSVADQLERRISHRRAIKQSVLRTMQRGAVGIRIKVAGRLGGSEMSRKDQDMQGRIPLHTLKANIDYGTAEASTTMGRIGVKVWIYKGDAPIEARRRQAAAQARAADNEDETPAVEGEEQVSVGQVEGGAPREAEVDNNAAT